MKTPWLAPSEALNRPLNHQTDDLILASSEENTETIRRLGFHIGNIGLLIAQHATSELTEMKLVCSIPFTAAWLVGLINLRGNLVPVFDLNMLMQIAKQPEKNPMLLILGQGELAGAIVIEDLPIHLTFSTADKLETLPPLPAVLKAFVSSGYEKQGDVWFNFDHLGFFESLATKVAV